MPVKPVLKALLLADQVYTDGNTGKDIIAGTFDCLFPVEDFPTEFARATFAYISVTDVHGEVPLVLQYVDLTTNQVLMECSPIIIHSDDPLQSIDFAVPVPPIPMPHAGVFAFELLAANELLGFIRVTVPDLDQGEEEEEDGYDDEGDFT